VRVIPVIAWLVLAMACKHEGSEIAIGLAIPSYVHGVAWIADDNGYFREAGFGARVDVLGGSAATARSLLAGSTEVGLLGGDTVIRADAAGGDLVIVGGLVNRFYHRLIGRAGLVPTTDLRGRKIGLPFLGGPQDMAVRYALRARGIAYGEVEIANLGREMNMMAALRRGDIDATTSQTPPHRIAELGFVVLDDLPAHAVAFPYLMIVVRRATLREHPERVRAALRALCRATEFFRGHRQDSLAIIDRYLHGADTTEAADERYATSGALISWPPVPDPAGLDTVRDLLGDDAGPVDPAKLIDLAILDDLRAAGECGGTTGGGTRPPPDLANEHRRPPDRGP